MAEYSTLSPSSILRERSAYENDSESDDAITDTESSYSLPSAPLTPRPHRASHSRAVHFDTDDQFFCFRRTDIPPHCTKHFFAPAQDTEAAERIEASLSDDNSVVEDWSHEYVFTDSEDEVVDGVQLADVDDVLPPRPSTPSPRYSFTALNDTYCSSSDNDDAGGSSQMYLPSMEGADGFGSSSGCESEHSLESLPTEESERSLQTPTPISGEDVGVSLGNGNKGSDMVVDDMDEEERKMDEALEGMLRCFGEMKKPLKPLEDFYNSDSDADNDKKEQIAQARTFKRVPKFRDYGALARRRSPVMKTQDSSSASSTPTASGPGSVFQPFATMPPPSPRVAPFAVEARLNGPAMLMPPPTPRSNGPSVSGFVLMAPPTPRPERLTSAFGVQPSTMSPQSPFILGSSFKSIPGMQPPSYRATPSAPSTSGPFAIPMARQPTSRPRPRSRTVSSASVMQTPPPTPASSSAPLDFATKRSKYPSTLSLDAGRLRPSSYAFSPLSTRIPSTDEIPSMRPVEGSRQNNDDSEDRDTERDMRYARVKAGKRPAWDTVGDQAKLGRMF